VDGDWIVVEGKGNTLASIAADLKDAKAFSYEEDTGFAVAAKSMRVAGELTIGGERTTGSLFRHANSLEFDVGQCGQARIVLPASGDGAPRLIVRNARIATLHTEQGNDACNAEGNLIDVAGGALALTSSVVTGNFVVRVGKGAVVAVDSTIASSNHAGLSVAELDSSKAHLAGLQLLDHQIYGMEVGPVAGPLVLESCTIRGGGADLHVRGRTELIARDCDFDSVRFAGAGGSVKRQWTVTVRTGRPGARVAAESEKGAALRERVEAKADASGVARLVLTEYEARPGRDYLKRGENDSTPHRIAVVAPDGKAAGSISNYRVLARGQEVRIP
jgi:hypothetical protein